MTATGMIRGRPVEWDGEIYRWVDTGEPAAGWGGEERPCPDCGLTAEGRDDPDPCLGWLPGVVSACCGHGVEEPFQITVDQDRDDDPHAPAWVAAVTLADLEAQRLAGWPDFHPEDFCHRCGRRNPVWWCDPETWNEATATERGLILCPSCFAAAHEEATGKRSCWAFRVETPGASS